MREKKKLKKSRYAASRYAIAPLPVMLLRVLLTTLSVFISVCMSRNAIYRHLMG